MMKQHAHKVKAEVNCLRRALKRTLCPKARRAKYTFWGEPPESSPASPG